MIRTRILAIGCAFAVILFLGSCSNPVGSNNSGETVPGIVPAEAPSVPASLTGSGGTTAQAVRAAALSDEELNEEYANFIIVPQIANNYNLYQDQIVSSIIDQASTDFDPSQWTALPDASRYDYEVSFDYGEYPSLLRVSEDFSRYELFMKLPDTGEVRHLVVEKYGGYTRSVQVMHRAGGADMNDVIEVTETADFILTRCVRVYDLDGNGDLSTHDPTDPAAGTNPASLMDFASITAKQSTEPTLGSLRLSEYAFPTDFSEATFEMPETVQSRVAAFDNERHMVRPDTLTEPLSYQIVNTPGQGETFTPSSYPALSGVDKLLTVGIGTSFAGDASIGEDFSYGYAFPQWAPSDIGF